MREPLYPSVYQISTRVWMTELSKQLGRPAAFDDLQDSEVDRFADYAKEIWKAKPCPVDQE